jgi:hypothetical protein
MFNPNFTTDFSSQGNGFADFAHFGESEFNTSASSSSSDLFFNEFDTEVTGLDGEVRQEHDESSQETEDGVNFGTLSTDVFQTDDTSFSLPITSEF